MTNEPNDNLVLQHLRAIRDELAGLRESSRETVLRLGMVETGLARLEGSTALLHSRFDRVVDRVDRVERRLEIEDGRTP